MYFVVRKEQNFAVWAYEEDSKDPNVNISYFVPSNSPIVGKDSYKILINIVPKLLIF